MTALLDPVSVAASRESADRVGRTGSLSRSPHGVPSRPCADGQVSANATSFSRTTHHESQKSPDPAPSIKDLDPLADFAHDFAKDSPDLFLKASMKLASFEFFTVLNRFDTGPLIKRLKEKPELYLPLINSFATLLKAWLERDKFEHRQKHAEALQHERDQKLRARKPILITAATITSISSSVGRTGPATRPPHGVPSRPCADGQASANATASVSSASSALSDSGSGHPSIQSSTNPASSSVASASSALTSAEPGDLDPWEKREPWIESAEEPSDDLVCCPS